MPTIARDLFSASSPTGAAVGGLVAFVLSFLLFVAVYRFVPAIAPPLRRVVLAALFAAVAFELLKRGFATTSRTSPTTTSSTARSAQ